MTKPTRSDACSLPPALREERLAWIRDEIAAARSTRAIPGGVLWEFDACPERRARLARLVALERACCDPEQLRFELHPDAADGRIRLSVHGAFPEDAPDG